MRTTVALAAKVRLYRRVWVGFILVVAIALNACSASLMATGTATDSRIVDSVLGDPKTFNYALNQSSPNVFGLIYDGLVESNGITGEIEPALAESWEISEDQKRIVFTLREDLRWSNGKPLTADDVLFTYNDIYLNEKIPTDTRDILRIGQERKLPQVRKINARQVEFTVPEPFAPFLRITGLPILPEHALREAVETTDSNGNPRFLSMWGTDADPTQVIGNGPYRLESYSTSQRVVFQRNPYYWRQDSEGNQQPYIEEFIWKIIENKDAQLLKFRSGDLDISEPMRPEDFPLLKREEKRGDFTIYVGGPRPGTVFIAFNLNRGSRNGKPLVDPVKSRWFNNLNFRRAVAYALNRQMMINTTFRGLGDTINSPITRQSPYYLSPEEGLPVYQHNLEQARKLLQEAGFTYDKGKLLDSEGNRVRFTLITNAENTIRVSLATQVQKNLAKIGIKVDLNPIAFNVLVDKLANTLDWECHLLGFTGGIEPNSGANIWMPDGGLHSFNQKPLPGQPEITGRVVYDWEAEIGRLYIEAAQELDEEKRKVLYAKTQILAQEYLPYIYLATELLMSAVRNNIQEIRYSDLGGALWNLYELNITQ